MPPARYVPVLAELHQAASATLTFGVRLVILLAEHARPTPDIRSLASITLQVVFAMPGTRAHQPHARHALPEHTKHHKPMPGAQIVELENTPQPLPPRRPRCVSPARPTPALRASVAAHWLVALATLDFMARFQVLAWYARPTPALRAVAAAHWKVVRATSGLRDATVLPAQRAPLENTKPRPAVSRAPTVEQGHTPLRWVRRLQRLARHVRLTLVLHVTHANHRLIVPATSGLQDQTAARARLVPLEPTKT